MPSPSTPAPPHPPEDNGSYPEDQEREDNETVVDSSLSIDEVVAWIVYGAPVSVLDDDDDEGIDGFDDDDCCGPARVLEPFDTRTVCNLFLDSVGWYYVE